MDDVELQVRKIEEAEELVRLKKEREESEREAVMKATLLYFEKTKPDMYYAICAFSASKIGSSIGNLYENIARYLIAEQLGVKNPLLKVTNGSIMIHNGVTSFSAQLVGELLYNKGYIYNFKYEDDESRSKELKANSSKTTHSSSQTVKDPSASKPQVKSNTQANPNPSKPNPSKPVKPDYRLNAKVTVTLTKKDSKFSKEFVLRGRDISSDLLNRATWKDSFRLMLHYRALSYAVRLHAPDVLQGGHSFEEAQSYALVEEENIEDIKKLVENN